MSRHVWLYAGSFDPVTLGHLEIVERAARLCDKLLIGIADNVDKHYLFSFEERMHLIQEELKTFKYNIAVVPITGLTIEYAFENKVEALVRGVRNGTDLDKEKQMAQINEELHWSIETILVPGKTYQHISSSALKELWKAGATEYQLATMAPKCVVQAMLEKRTLRPL